MIDWKHSPGKPVPYRSSDRRYSIGVNFHGMYQAIFSGNLKAEAIGEPCVTPELAKCEAERDARTRLDIEANAAGMSLANYLAWKMLP